MKTVLVDWNEFYRHDKEGMLACYPEHVSDKASLEIGEEVWMDDEEGLKCKGTVIEFVNFGRGDLVRMKASEDFVYYTDTNTVA